MFYTQFFTLIKNMEFTRTENQHIFCYGKNTGYFLTKITRKNTVLAVKRQNISPGFFFEKIRPESFFQ